MYNMEIEKKQKHKLAAIVIGMVIVIVLLVVAIVIVTTNKSTQTNVISETESNEFLIDNNEAKTETKPEETKTETVTKKETKVETISTKTTKNTEKMPATGPVDLLPIAIVLGLMTTGVTAFAMNKRKM